MKNKKLIGVILASIAAFSLITYTVKNGSFNVFNSAVTDTGAWVGKVVSAPVNGAVRFFNSIDTVVNTFEENQRLKSKINQVNELQVRVADLEAENEKMRQELDLKQIPSEYSTIHSTVIARNPDQWMETLMIDVGSDDGVEVGMAVMAGNGLIGRIIETNLSSSKVMLLTSEQSSDGKVAASIQVDDKNTNSVNGIISGYNAKDKNYVMTQVDPNVKVKEGDMVITSGLGGVIPSSLLIGEVDKVSMDSYGLFQTVEVKPAGEMTDIRFVTVIDREGRIETE